MPLFVGGHISKLDFADFAIDQTSRFVRYFRTFACDHSAITFFEIRDFVCHWSQRDCV